MEKVKDDIPTLWEKEEQLKQALGDKYDQALELSYDLLQVRCGLQEMRYPVNSFMDVHFGNPNPYYLTKYGFRQKELNYEKPVKEKRSWWSWLFPPVQPLAN